MQVKAIQVLAIHAGNSTTGASKTGTTAIYAGNSNTGISNTCRQR